MILEYLEKSSDTVGIIGVILLLMAYYLLSVNKISAKSIKYQILNLTGAILILFSLMFHWNTASVVIEIAWISISLLGIYRSKKDKPIKRSNVYAFKLD